MSRIHDLQKNLHTWGIKPAEAIRMRFPLHMRAWFTSALIAIIMAVQGTAPLSGVEVNREEVSAYQYGISGFTGTTIYVGSRADDGNHLAVSTSGGPSGVSFAGSWQLHDSPLQKRTGSVHLVFEHAGNLYSACSLGGAQGYLHQRASVEANWEITEFNVVAPEFEALFSEWQQWRNHPGNGIRLFGNQDSVLPFLEGWNYQEFIDATLDIPVQTPINFDAADYPGGTSEYLALDQGAPTFTYSPSLGHMVAFNNSNSTASQNWSWRAGNGAPLHDPERPFWSVNGRALLQSGPSHLVNTTPISHQSLKPDSFEYLPQLIYGDANSNGHYTQGTYGPSIPLLPLPSSTMPGGGTTVDTPSLIQALTAAWTEAFLGWQSSPDDGGTFPANAKAWRLFFSGYVWDTPHGAQTLLPPCGVPIPWEWSWNGNEYLINPTPGDTGWSSKSHFGIRTDLTALTFAITHNDTRFNGSVPITFDASGSPTVQWGQAGYSCTALSTDPRIGSVPLYSISGVEVPASVREAGDKLFAAYAVWLQGGNPSYLPLFLDQGIPCDCGTDPLILCMELPGHGVSDGEDDCPKPTPPSAVSGSKRSPTLPMATSRKFSVIDNHRLTYRHDAVDYAPAAGDPGCAPCGGLVGGESSLPAVSVQRFHRYHDHAAPSSFGPGVFDGYDLSVRFGTSTQEPHTGLPAAWIMDPRLRYEVELINVSSGDYVDVREQLVIGLQLRDTQDAQTTDVAQAATAVLTTHAGVTFHFDIIDLAAGPDVVRAGRLGRITDRQGNATTINYVHARDASDADLGDNRQLLWQRTVITDTYGQQLGFTYRATAVAGRPVVERIDLPNGEQLSYTYADGATFSLDPLVGLTGVAFPDGEVATFTGGTDAATQCWTLSIDDAGADTTHRRKTVSLSKPEYLPIGGGEALAQPPYRVRRVLNGDGETSYWNWVTPLSGGDIAVIIGEGGTVARYVVDENGVTKRIDRATNWVDGIDLADVSWELDVAVAVSGQNRVSATIDPQNRTKSYSRDHASGKPTRIDYADGTHASTTYNAAAQPLVEIDRLGRRTEHTYDAQGNHLTRHDAVGTPAAAQWQWTYNDRGQMLSQTDPNGNVTDYAYYPEGHAAQFRLHTITHPADDVTAPAGSESAQRAVETFVWDAAGRLHQSSDPEGRTVTLAYDRRNRLTRRTYGDGSFETIEYGSGADANLVVAETDRNGNTTQYAYDAAGRKVTTIRAAGTPEAVTEVCTYLPGTTREATCTQAGNRRETTYDHRLRPVASTVYPHSDRSLITASVFDASNRLLRRIDAFGRATVFVHDVNDRVIRTLSEAIPGALDDVDAATVLRPTGTNPPFVLEETVFDAEGQVTARIDARGIRSTFQYDAQGRLSAQVDADARLLSNGSWERLPEAARTEMAYDAAGNVIAIRHPRSFTRDADGAWLNGPDGDFRTVRTYTGRHRLASETVAAGLDAASQPRPEQATRTWTYTLTGQIRSETDERGFTTTRTYGVCCDRLHTITDPTGVIVATYGYDAHGNVLTVTDGNTLTTAQTYDARHRVRTRTNAAGETSTFTYDDDLTDGLGLDADPLLVANLGFGPGATGSAVAVTNPALETSRQVHDGLGRAVRSVTPLGHATTTTFDTVVGTLVETAVTDPLLNTVRSHRDGLGRERQRIDALGTVALTIGYDASGNVVRTRDAAHVGQDCVIDGRGRDIACTDTRGFTTTRIFDAHGNILQSTDADGHRTVAVFDARDRQTNVTDRVGAVTAFAYDAAGNLLQLTDAEGGVTAYTYDARGLLTEERFPQGQQGKTVRTYVYDAGRRLAERQVTTDAVVAPPPSPAILALRRVLDQLATARMPERIRQLLTQIVQRVLVRLEAAAPPSAPVFVEVTQYAYDAANRLVERGYPDELNDSFQYDLGSRLVVAASGRYQNQVERQYDTGGRLTGEWLIGQGNSALAGAWSVWYGYDAANRVRTLTYPNGNVVTRDYTARNQLEAITHGGTPIATRRYDTAGRLTTTTLGNSLTETRTYTPGAHLVATIHIPGVTDFSYVYDAQNRKTTETDAVRPEWSQSFGYDLESRLTTWTRGEGVVPVQTQDWNLTLVGDWAATTRDDVVETRQHSAVHELTARTIGANPALALGYDAKGNLTDDGDGRIYLWDPENRLREARTPPAVSPTGQPLLSTYAYDALGRRVAKTVNGRVMRFIHAGAQVIQEEDGLAIAPLAEQSGDGTVANLAEVPASGGILPASSNPAAPVIRVNFQPIPSVTPPGFVADKGRAFGVRTNDLSYGWSAPLQNDDRIQRFAASLEEWDTFIRAARPGSPAQTWRIALPNGTYPVIVVAGDAVSRNHTNHLVIGGIAVTDPDPATMDTGYELGDFDGYAVQITVTDGFVTIAPDVGAYDPTLCFIEIGPEGTTITPEVEARLADMVESMTTATFAPQAPSVARRQYVWGPYVDELLAYTVGNVRYFVHNNHLFSPAAVTDGTGGVVERYAYDAFGTRTVTNAAGTVELATSNVSQSRGFTGYILDQETGHYFARTRIYSSSNGRFYNRMPWRLIDSGVEGLLQEDVLNTPLNRGAMVLSNYSVEVVDSATLAFHMMALRKSRGSYIQERYSLYDFMKNAPNGVEPYSTHRLEPGSPGAEGSQDAPNSANLIDTLIALDEFLSGPTEIDGEPVYGGAPPSPGRAISSLIKCCTKESIDLAKQLALKEAAGKGRRIMKGLIDDPKYPETVWAKMQHVHHACDGSKITVHYWKNLKTGLEEGFKIK